MKIWSLALLLCVPMFGSACQSTSSAQQIEESIPNLPPYDGPKARIALRNFEWKAQQGYRSYGDNIIGGLEDLLTDSLVNSDRYVVLERAQFGDIKDEVGMVEDGWIDGETGPEKGKAIGADLAIFASVNEWNPDAAGSDISGKGVGWISGKLGIGGGSMKTKKGICAITVRIFDMNTSETLVSRQIRGEAKSRSFGVNGFGITNGLGLGGGLSQYEDTPMGSAIRKAIAEAVAMIADETPTKYMKY